MIGIIYMFCYCSIPVINLIAVIVMILQSYTIIVGYMYILYIPLYLIIYHYYIYIHVYVSDHRLLYIYVYIYIYIFQCRYIYIFYYSFCISWNPHHIPILKSPKSTRWCPPTSLTRAMEKSDNPSFHRGISIQKTQFMGSFPATFDGNEG